MVCTSSRQLFRRSAVGSGAVAASPSSPAPSARRYAALGLDSVNPVWRAEQGRCAQVPPIHRLAQAAGWELKLQHPRKIQGPVAISIAAGRPDQRKRDLDNIATKAVLDLLVAHGVIEDDFAGVPYRRGLGRHGAARHAKYHRRAGSGHGLRQGVRVMPRVRCWGEATVCRGGDGKVVP